MSVMWTREADTRAGGGGLTSQGDTQGPGVGHSVGSGERNLFLSVSAESGKREVWNNLFILNLFQFYTGHFVYF